MVKWRVFFCVYHYICEIELPEIQQLIQKKLTAMISPTAGILKQRLLSIFGGVKKWGKIKTAGCRMLPAKGGRQSWHYFQLLVLYLYVSCNTKRWSLYIIRKIWCSVLYSSGSLWFQVSQVLAEKYLDALEAPRKAFFIFSDSAHSPNMEEPEKFIEVFRKIALENPAQK